MALAAPAALSESVVRAAVSSRVAWAASAAVSSTVSQVVEGVMRMFWIKKATALVATVFAVFAFGIGVGITGRQVEGVAEGQEKGAGTAPKTDSRIEDIDEAITQVEQQIKLCTIAHDRGADGIREVKKRIDRYRNKTAALHHGSRNDLIMLSRCEGEIAKAKAEMATLKGLLEKLKAMKAAKEKAEKPQTDKNGPRQSYNDHFQKLKEEFEQMERGVQGQER